MTVMKRKKNEIGRTPTRRNDKLSFSENERTKAVKLVLFKKYSYEDAAKEVGRSASTVYKWVRRHSDEAKEERREEPQRDKWPPKHLFPKEKQMEAVRLVLIQGYSYRKTAEVIGSSVSSVQNWVYRLGGKIAENIIPLKRKCGSLKNHFQTKHG